MSVLSFPRIYFKGFLGWDPCTFNNNDWMAFQTYDAVNAALNWSFLETQGITQENFPTTFRPWAIKLQKDPTDSPKGPRVPAEWNMFGTHASSFVNYNEFQTAITSGATGWNQPVTDDPMIGGGVTISGDGGGGSAKLVDTNPSSFWSSQIYFGQMSFGGNDAMIIGPRNFRMHSRWLDLKRIYSSDQVLTQPAASVGCCFQTCVPFNEVTWPAESSSALAWKLQQAASTDPAIGIMVRFTAYVNLYFQNGVFNNTTQRPSNYEDLAKLLAAAWAAWDANGDTSQFFSQPCYSHIVGTLGVWKAGEVASAPVGRYLSASGNVAALNLNPITPPPPQPVVPPVAQSTEQPMGHEYRAMAMASAAPAQAAVASAAPLQVTLGPIVAEIDYNNELISLDLNSTIPENGTPGKFPSDLSKTNFGPLDFGVLNAGDFTSIYQIPYEKYRREAYEGSAGIIDIPFSETTTGSNTTALLQGGTLAIQVQGQSAMEELQFSAQTDSRGIYVDEGGGAEFVVAAYNFGASALNTPVIVAQYDANLSLIPTTGSPLIAFTNGDVQQLTSGGVTTTVTSVTTDETGVATVTIEWVAAGFAVLAFYPYTEGNLPSPPISLLGPDQTTSGSITYAFYTTVRALPPDNAVPQQFVDLWNSSDGDQTQAWNFIYNQILYVYDMLFNVMLAHVNLGSQMDFASSIYYIWPTISAEEALESSQAMPITRDLSAGKRLALQLWIYLIANDYSVPDFNVNSIPSGWAPPPPPTR
jgi:hypothetical protein